jgi:hypothetical protein
MVVPACQLPGGLEWLVTLNCILALHILELRKPGVSGELETECLLIGCFFSLSLGPRLSGHLQKCPRVHFLTGSCALWKPPTFPSSPSCACVLWHTWNKMELTRSYYSFSANLFLGRFIFWPTLHTLVADSHRIQNQVVSIRLVNSVHNPLHSPAFVLPGNMCISCFPPQARTSTLLFGHSNIPHKATLNFCQKKMHPTIRFLGRCQVGNANV